MVDRTRAGAAGLTPADMHTGEFLTGPVGPFDRRPPGKGFKRYQWLLRVSSALAAGTQPGPDLTRAGLGEQ